MDKIALKKKLEQFKRNLSKRYPVHTMILFGSSATGKTHKWSDIDLVIVSPKFRKLGRLQRGAQMYDYWTLKKPVDFLCYTPEEFTRMKKRITIIRDAVKEGIEI